MRKTIKRKTKKKDPCVFILSDEEWNDDDSKLLPGDIKINDFTDKELIDLNFIYFKYKNKFISDKSLINIKVNKILIMWEMEDDIYIKNRVNNWFSNTLKKLLKRKNQVLGDGIKIKNI